MGYRGAALCGFLAVVVVLIQALGTCVFPLHKTYVSTAFGFAQVFRFDVYSIWWQVDMHTSDFCTIHKLAEDEKGDSFISRATLAWKSDNPDAPQDFCDWLTGGGDLQDASARFCGAALQLLLPSLCVGLEDAFQIGFALVVTLGGNALCMIAAVGLLVNYSHAEKPKRRYRINALIILLFATMCVGAALALEYFLPLHKLDAGSGIGRSMLASNAGGDSGLSAGFYMLASSAVVELGIVIMCGTVVRSSREIDDNDHMAEKAWLRQKEVLMNAQHSAGTSQYYGAPEIAPQALYYGGPVPEMAMPGLDNYGGAAYASYPQADPQYQEQYQQYQHPQDTYQPQMAPAMAPAW